MIQAHVAYYFAQIFKDGDLKVPKKTVDSNVLATVLQIVFGFAGAIALLIITIAGFRYVTSQGKPQEVAKAKDTIIYAIVGLIVSMTAFSIVKFVLTRV